MDARKASSPRRRRYNRHWSCLERRVEHASAGFCKTYAKHSGGNRNRNRNRNGKGNGGSDSDIVALGRQKQR
ncbi:hypothetical protein IFM47457_01498 [Aspergillus lentulus]|nr:hypothetical protein IFM47457_01498 [Aspergillus lentulus]